MKNNNFSEVEKYLKRVLKNKFKVEKSTIIAYLMLGVIGLSSSAFAVTNTAGNGISYNNTQGLAVGYGEALGNSQAIAIGGDKTDEGKAKANGGGAIAIGGNSRATGTTTTAVGWNAKAEADNATAIGKGSKATAANSVALGVDSNVNPAAANAIAIGTTTIGSESGQPGDLQGKNSIGIGTGIKVKTSNTVAIGTEIETINNTNPGTSVDYMKDNVLIGNRLSSTLTNNIVIGNDSKTKDSVKYSIVMGSGASTAVLGNNGNRPANNMAIGTKASAEKEEAISIGANALSTEAHAVAVGANTEAKGNRSLAVGKQAKALGAGATAVGYDTNASESTATAIGYKAKAIKGGATALGDTANASNDRAVALGSNAAAGGLDSAAMGSKAQATGNETVAIGKSAKAIGNNSITLGSDSTSNNASNIAIGDEVNVSGEYSIAMGNKAKTTKENSIAIGREASVTNQGAVAIGLNAETTGERAVTIGTTAITGGAVTKATAKGIDSVAIGTGAVAEAGNSLAFGLRANTTTSASSAVALGVSSKAEASQALALGSFANAKRENTIAIGTNAKADGKDNIAIGTKAGYNSTQAGVGVIIGSEAGSDANFNIHGYGEWGTVLIGQRAGQGIQGDSNIAIGSDAGNKQSGSQNIFIGDNTKMYSSSRINIGNYDDQKEKGFGNRNIILGQYYVDDRVLKTDKTNNYINDTISIGTLARGVATKAIAIGSSSKNAILGARASGERAIAIGTSSSDDKMGAQAEAADSVALGTDTKVTKIDSTAIGKGAQALEAYSIALGAGAKTVHQKSVALGSDSITTTGTMETTEKVGEITYGDFAGVLADTNHVVSVGGGTVKERQIKNVASGKISKTSTDAINGSQLYATNNVIGNVAQTLKTEVLGGNAEYIKTGDAAGSFTFTDIGKTGKDTIHDAILASKEIVKAGTNIASVETSERDDQGQITYTINAKGATVTTGDGLKVKSTPDTNTNITTHHITLDTTTLAVDNTTGAVTVPTGGEENKVVKAGDLATALNSTGWNVESTTATGKSKQLVKNGETVKLEAGDNLELKQAGKDFTYSLKKQLDLTNAGSITVGDTVINNGGITANQVTVKNDPTADTDATNKKYVDGKVDGVTLKTSGNTGTGSVKLKDQTLSVTATATGDIKASTAANEQGIVVNVDSSVIDKKIADNKTNIANNKTAIENINNTINAGGFTVSASGGTKDKIAKNENIDFSTDGVVTVSYDEATNKFTHGLEQATKDKIDNAADKNLTNLTVDGKKVVSGLVTGVGTGNITVTEEVDQNTGVKTITVDGSNLAKNDLSNITAAGNTVVKNLAKEAVKVKAGKNITVDEGTEGEAKTYTINAEKSEVTTGDGLKVKSTPDTNTNITTHHITLDTTTLAVDNATGKVTVPTGGEENKVVKAGDLATALNSTGWNVESTTADGKSKQLVKNGETVKFEVGDNLELKQAGKDFTYSLKKDISLTSVTTTDAAGNKNVSTATGNTLTDKDGNKIETTASGVTITDKDGNTTVVDGAGIRLGDTQITGDRITAKHITIHEAPVNPTDATNKEYVDSTKTQVESENKTVKVIKKVKGNADVYDLSVDMTKVAEQTDLAYKANGTNKQTVKLSDGLDFKDGTHTVATVAANGEVKYDLSQETKNKVDNAANKDLSNLTEAGKTVINNIAKESIKVEAGSPNVSVKSEEKDNKMVYTIDINKDLSLDSVTAADKDGNTNVLTSKHNVLTDKDGNTNISTATSNTLRDADGNITETTASGTTVTDKDGNKTVVDAKGITITSPAGKEAVSLTAKGLNNGGNKITNIADGEISETSKEAINGSQLHEVKETLAKDIAAAKTTVTSNDKTIEVTPKVNDKTGATNYDLSIKDKSITENKLSDDVAKKLNLVETVVAGSSNVIVKQESTNSTGGKEFKVDIAKNLEVDSLKTGDTIIDNKGLSIKNGPSITNTGIDVADKKITNVEAGDVSATSKDAINGSQLHKVANSIQNTYGGNAVVNPDGSITITNIGGTGKNNLNDAIAASKTEVESGANTTVSHRTGDNGQAVYKVDVKGDLTDISSISNGDTKIVLGKDEAGNKVVSTEGARITNVAPGVKPTDAVNVSQIREAEARTNQKISDLEQSTSKGIANAIAQSGIEFQEIGINQVVIGAAVGFYKGEGAVAVGLQGAPTENVRVHTKVSATPGANTNAAVSIGASWRLNIR